MVLSKFKQFFPKQDKYPPDFVVIAKNLFEDELQDEENFKLLWKAYNFGNSAHVGQKRRSGKPYFTHCIQVGQKLSEWNLDLNTIIAGLLHDTIEDTDVTKEDIINNFNFEIAELVEGVSKLSGIRFTSRKEKQAENYMKMFLSVAQDIRVILIKFADRLHNMKTIEHLPLIKQRRIAIETKDLFSPLAHRLGMNSLKVEFEDLILKTLEPKIFKDLVKKIKSTKKQREKYISMFSQPIQKEMGRMQIDTRIFGRAKHYFSIYGKMIKRNKSFDEIYDLFAIRIIVNKIEDCYAVLGAVHQVYNPIQDRFKDYIATPKSNGYQSIHTSVSGIMGKIVEVQIRTDEMDKTAEIGVAAHWNYKENKSIDSKSTSKIDRQVKWLRELVESLRSEESNPDEFLKLLKIDLFKDEIFVFTPAGDLIQLPQDSTPIDFAFQVHSSVGMQCKGAKVNGKIVPLNTKLKNGDYIEVITSKNHKPPLAWLKVVQTVKAKSHIKRFVKKEQNEQSRKLGKEILEKTLRRLKKINIIKDIEKNTEVLGLANIESVYSEISTGKLTVRDIIDKFTPNEVEDVDIESETFTEKFINKARGVARGVKVDGVSNALIAFAKCCNPIPGDEIIGYITRGRGITIHITECSNLPTMHDTEEDRFINVEWDVSADVSFIVRLKIVAADRKNLLKDITESISSLNINITSVDINAKDSLAVCILIIDARDTKQVSRLTNKLSQIKDVMFVERV